MLRKISLVKQTIKTQQNLINIFLLILLRIPDLNGKELLLFCFLKLFEDQSGSLCVVHYNSNLLGVKCLVFILILIFIIIVYYYILQLLLINQLYDIKMFIASLNVILKLYFDTVIFLLGTHVQFYKISLLSSVF